MGKNNLRIFLLKLTNIAAVTGAFAVGWLYYYNDIITWSYQYKGNIAVTLLFATLYFLLVKVYDAYAIRLQRKMELAISQILSAFFRRRTDVHNHLLFV